jgi:HK97 family phage major capsid protein
MAMVGGDAEARERLVRHKVEMDVEMPAREARQTAQFERALDTLSEGERRAIVEKRDITRTDGAGGEFVPPLWLLDLYAELPRAGRPFANRCRQIPLPGGTDSISIPRITTGTQVAAQTADNAAVNEQDLVTNSVTGPVRTIAGQQDIALQLLEQSPLMFDELVWADLAADYAAKLDVQCLNGTGLNGQHTGAMQVSSINSVTYTDASPTVPELYPSLPQALSKIASNRLLPPDFWTMHPRRWYWLLAALDSSNRPLVVPVAQGAYMALGAATAVEAEGVVGSLVGLPVLVDANIPATLTNGAGTGGTEDAIVAARMQDIILFEGAMRTRALPEVLSGTLTVRLQAYAYSAFIAGRQPKAIAAVTGTGLAAPSGF